MWLLAHKLLFPTQYICLITNKSIYDLSNIIQTNVIIIGNDVSKKDAQKITTWCEQNKVKVHDIKKEGTYVLTYN